ncbi:G1/S-specific cyclin-D2 [Drosophila madeirensis]|uniref:G1/S-specific cyclin-D2 n=1 Tax=Drosophila madeirensis TaxID=30013 RepID=A0AAU9FWT3_DROMD
MQNMDLLCSESIVCDSDSALYRINQQQTLAEPRIRTDLSSVCSSITSDSSGNVANTIAASNPSNSSNNSVACKRSEIVYIYASAESLRTQNQSHQLQEKGMKDTVERITRNFSKEPSAVRLQGWQSKSDPLGSNYVNTAIGDPTFKSDRCLENALKAEEKHQHIVETYFRTVQRDITPAMRKIVVEWMMEVCAEEKCQEEVVLLALNYMDRFLSTKSVRKTHLQILAAACLLLASKLREPSCRALSVELLVVYTDNSIYKEDLIKWELYVLSRLGWDLSSVTPLDFLDLLIIRMPINSKIIPDISIAKVRQHAKAFISMAAKEHQFAKYPASTIAASSIAASMSGLKWHLRTVHNLHFLLGLLTDLTSIEQVQLQECMLHMEAIFEEHSRNLQPFFVNIEHPKTAKMYYQRRCQTHPTQQYQQQRPQRIRQMPAPSLSLTTAAENADQNCFKAARPYRTQTLKMLGQAKTELQDIQL